MGVCSIAVVASATVSSARRSRSSIRNCFIPVKEPHCTGSKSVQQTCLSSPRHKLCRFRHRWRRAHRLSAAVPSSVAAATSSDSKHLDEDINFGPELLYPACDDDRMGRSPPLQPVHTKSQSQLDVVDSAQSVMYSVASTNSSADYGSVMESPLFSKQSSAGEERLKRRIRFFFLNPIQKWVATRRFPFKLFIQIVKIIFVTVQLCLFASFRDSHVFYARNTEIAFSHIFLQEWDVTREAPSYPPSAGPLAVYDKQQFYQYLDFAVQNYAVLESGAMGSYFRVKNDKGFWMSYCQTDYVQTQFEPTENKYSFDSHTKRECLSVPFSDDMSSFKSEDFLASNNVTVNGLSLVEAELSFSIKAIHFKPNGPTNSPDCYLFDLRIVFDNQGQDGQLLVSLITRSEHVNCHGKVNPPVSDASSKNLRSSVNILVILTCIFSFILCARAVIKAQILKWETNRYFVRHFNRHLSKHDRLEFLNLWYVLIIINDVLLVAGSIIKELMENKHVENDMWDVCSVLLGTGNLFVWFGVLRYLGFFRTYNMLIVTLKKAFPSVLRFLLCALLIYSGFTFCGWLIFGPYHFKFQTISSTSECLFSLVNGDDMFATFAGMSQRSPLVWWFSRLYLYSFISLFIYVVLSLFIALIMDTYETIKMYYTEGFPKSDLRQFLANDDCVDGIPVYEPQTCFLHWSRLFSRKRGYESIEEEQEEQRILA